MILAVSTGGRVGKCLTGGRTGEVGPVRGCPEPQPGRFHFGLEDQPQDRGSPTMPVYRSRFH